MATLVRKDAWKLSAISTWEPTLLWYGKAIGEMSRRPAADPTSWRYQAGMHGYSKSSDPFLQAGPVLNATLQKKFWKQCQHGTWFFLPWHRMYLGFFEQIVRATVVKLGGPAHWTLPYWDYSDTSNPDRKKLPPAFRQAKLPDGSPNPLFVIQGVNIPRAPGINTGNASLIPDRDVNIAKCLKETFFSPGTDVTTGDLGFGGPATGANHDAQVFGQNSVESVPHNAIHVDVGGQWTQGGNPENGWMIDPDTAALDPIFWLHHANIDRLWSVWNRVSAGNTNPSGSVNVGGKNITWATSVKFAFHDAAGKVVSMTPNQVVDTTTSPFTYDYQNTGSPLPPPAHAVAAPTGGTAMRRTQQPEMLGASGKKVTLTGKAHTETISIQSPSGPARAKARAAATAPSGRTFLNIENVVAKESNTTYEVYVNLPEDAKPTEYEEHHAGSLHLFGVKQASVRSERHAGNGLNFSLDITGLVEHLKEKNAWNETNLRVVLLPRGKDGAARRSIAAHDPIKVGRISLYRA